MNTTTQTSRVAERAGFTTLEIMIVVSIIALLSALALPRFMESRNRAQETHLISDLRTVAAALEQYAITMGDYPPDSPAASIPSGLNEFTTRFHWDRPSAVGGLWDWDKGAVGLSDSISLLGPSLSDDRAQLIDRRIDDGDLVTGFFQKRADGGGFVLRVGG